MKLLDTNVVIYSLGHEHPYREPCRVIVNQLEARPYDYAIDTEMLQELLCVFINREDVATGIGVVNRLLELFPDVIPVAGPDIAAATRLLAQSNRLSVRDAIHAAVVLEHGLEGIVSSDRAFDHIASCRRFDPRGVADGC